MEPHPIQLTISDPDDRRRSRLHAWFMGFLLIPHVVVLYVYGAIAGLALVGAWFAALFTGRVPQGLHDFLAGYLLYSMRVSSYVLLLTRRWPPFPGSTDPYPLNMTIEDPVKQGRLGVFFRFLMIIPAMVVITFLSIPLMFTWPASWIMVMITGRIPEGCQGWGEKVHVYTARLAAYVNMLTPVYPKGDSTGGSLAPQQPMPAMAAANAPAGSAGPFIQQ